jgi:hypothetical protein
MMEMVRREREQKGLEKIKSGKRVSNTLLDELEAAEVAAANVLHVVL